MTLRAGTLLVREEIKINWENKVIKYIWCSFYDGSLPFVFFLWYMVVYTIN